MNNYICVGKIINTFGIKGELKITSDFEYKDRIFINGFSLYVGDNYEKLTISNHKIHKDNYIVLFDNLSNINDVLKYKSLFIYIKKEDLKLNDDEYLVNDLIGFDVYDNEEFLGNVDSFEYSKLYILLKIKGNKVFYLPKIDKFINKIDFDNKKIYTNGGSELVL